MNWKSKENQDRTSSDAAHMHAIEALDNIIRSKQHLHNSTGCEIEVFQYLLEKFSRHVMADPDIPLFEEDSRSSTDWKPVPAAHTSRATFDPDSYPGKPHTGTDRCAV